MSKGDKHFDVDAIGVDVDAKSLPVEMQLTNALARIQELEELCTRQRKAITRLETACASYRQNVLKAIKTA